MDEPYSIETRRRSRSNTPFLRSNCDNEQCQHAGEEHHLHHRRNSPIPKKIPRISTIIEESTSTKVTTKLNEENNSDITKKASNRKISSAVTTSDYSSNSSEDLTADANSRAIKSKIIEKINGPVIIIDDDNDISNKITTKTTTTKTIITKKSNQINNLIKQGGETNISKEINQNELNSKYERNNSTKVKTSTPILKTDQNFNSSVRITSPNLSGNSDDNDHLAYIEYREAGEYWKKFPKTDYTYSKLSPYRRELAPGVVAMPNMSRGSLEKHNERIRTMIQRNPAQEEFIRRRYLSQYNQHEVNTNREQLNNLLYDSQDEVDIPKTINKNYNNSYLNIKEYNEVNEETSFITTFMTFITTIITKITNIFTSNQNENHLYRTKLYTDQGIFSRSKSAIISAISKIFSNLYFMISSVLYLDTWLLRSSSADNKNKKRFLLCLLILLPFLLLMAWSFFEENDWNVMVSKIQNLLPMSLLGLRTILPLEWRNIFNWNLFQYNLISNANHDTPIYNIKKVLSQEEYENLLSHINLYVQKSIDSKYKDDLSIVLEKQNSHFNNKILEKQTSYFPTNEDLEKIVEAIKLKLTDQGYPGPFVLQNEIDLIKEKLNEKIKENQDLFYSIDLLKLGHNDLSSRMEKNSKKLTDKIEQFIAEMSFKFDKFKEENSKFLTEQIKLSVINFFNSNDKNINFDKLKTWIENMYVAKDYLEQILQELSIKNSQYFKKEIERSSEILMKNINEKLKKEILVEINGNQNNNIDLKLSGTTLSEKDVKKIVKDILMIYDADKTGLVDYALESAGGHILSTRCTENYQTKSARISIFGIPLWYPSNTPRIVISPAVQPGECWAFQGFPGFLVLKLNTNIFVTGFTLEHISKYLTPNGKIDSAPKNFTVWGLTELNDQEPILFGEYQYTDKDNALQYFPVLNKNIIQSFDIVELRIESNHGNLAYTCLYRFRVHGKPS